jgi:hypothetical protein
LASAAGIETRGPDVQRATARPKAASKTRRNDVTLESTKTAGMALVAAACFAAGSASAASVSFTFSGKTSVTMDGVAAGTPFSGTFSYDPGATAPGGTVPFHGGTETVYQSAYTSLAMTIGSHTVHEVVPGPMALYDSVDPPSGVPKGDSLYTFKPGTLPNASVGSFAGLTPNYMYLGFVDTTGQVFSGGALPASLSLGAFSAAFIGVNFHPFGAGNTTTISSLTTLAPIPEPAAWVLMAAGLGGLAVARRRRV